MMETESSERFHNLIFEALELLYHRDVEDRWEDSLARAATAVLVRPNEQFYAGERAGMECALAWLDEALYERFVERRRCSCENCQTRLSSELFELREQASLRCADASLALEVMTVVLGRAVRSGYSGAVSELSCGVPALYSPFLMSEPVPDLRLTGSADATAVAVLRATVELLQLTEQGRICHGRDELDATLGHVSEDDLERGALVAHAFSGRTRTTKANGGVATSDHVRGAVFVLQRRIEAENLVCAGSGEPDPQATRPLLEEAYRRSVARLATYMPAHPLFEHTASTIGPERNPAQRYLAKVLSGEGVPVVSTAPGSAGACAVSEAESERILDGELVRLVETVCAVAKVHPFSAAVWLLGLVHRV